MQVIQNNKATGKNRNKREKRIEEYGHVRECEVGGGICVYIMLMLRYVGCVI